MHETYKSLVIASNDITSKLKRAVHRRETYSAEQFDADLEAFTNAAMACFEVAQPVTAAEEPVGPSQPPSSTPSADGSSDDPARPDPNPSAGPSAGESGSPFQPFG